MFNLTGWRTLSEVNAASGIPYEALRQTAKRASEKREPWVQMDRWPRRWILNTENEHFEQAITQVLALHSFSSLVTQDKAEDENDAYEDDENDAYEDENDDDDDEACDFFLLDNKNDVLASPIPPLPPLPPLSASTRGMSSLFSSAFFHDPTASLGRIWPELRQWLLDEGVLIFSNVLEADTDRVWQWDWGNCGGAGCGSVEEAVLSALQTKLKRSRDMERQSAAACARAEAEAEKDTRRHWFGRR